MPTHAEARAIILRAWPTVITDRAPTLAEVYAVQAVSLGESSYGGGWAGHGHAPDAVTSHNWGAIQCRTHWSKYRVDVSQFPRDPKTGRPDLSSHPVPSAEPGHCFLAVDSSPTKEGQKWYAGTYRWYATDDEGAADVIRLLERMNVLKTARESRHVWSVSARMYDAGYYQGFSTDRTTAINQHAKGMAQRVDTIAKALGEQPGLGIANAPAAPAPGGGDSAGFPGSSASSGSPAHGGENGVALAEEVAELRKRFDEHERQDSEFRRKLADAFGGVR